MHSQTIENLIKLFSKFPTVGPRTAARFVFYLIKSPNEKVQELLKSVEELKDKIKTCQFCFKPFEGESKLCSICADPRRDKSLVCIVVKEVDLEAIEKTNQFKGLYFILGGTISGLTKEEQTKALEDRVSTLIARIKNASKSDDRPKLTQIKEVILALNPTTEGQNTALWLRRKLEPTGVRITQLGRGLPVGGELEYADEETLSSAISNRH